MNDYIIVTPVRNEEDYFGKTLESVANQTIKPKEWIIVNDGSTDKTPDLIDDYRSQYSWIKRVDRPQNDHRPGPGVVLAFYDGFEKRTDKNFDFVIKLDADLSFEPDYFEFLLNEFAQNPKMGMASGTTYNVFGENLVIDKMPEDHVRGAAKMYRKECFDQIGGIQVVLGWDTLDELKAQMLGWETRSYKHLVLKHYKPIGFKQKNTLKRELLAGERLNYLGYHPLFAILKCFYNLRRKPFLVGGALMFAGYLGAVLGGGEKNPDKEMVKFYRKKQMKRLSEMVGFSK
ncbi:MAG: glycosyltransferase family 2 protein [Bacteroidales bacterium]|nr:glycosyltransferase family 2 protein [Bacteroidales bacterium]